VTTSGDTQVLPRIPVPGVAAGSARPTVALTIAPAPQPAPAPAPEPAKRSDVQDAAEVEVAVEPAPEAPAESHERIYEEAMATIAALASGWASLPRTSGRHRAAA
jgi:hypothetical protein